jgi:DNA-binding NarL/FixJ family response regulator
VQRVRPQVVLLDVQLPGADGFAVAERLARERHPPAIVLISSRDSAARDPRFTTTAARGFIPKSRLSGTSLAELLG